LLVVSHCNGCGSGIQYRDVKLNVDLCVGLSGNLTYTFESYWSSPTNNVNGSGTIYENNSGSNYIATFITDATLSVTYVNILAKPNSKGVAINWSTATETENSYFKIEHSGDGEVFNSVGEIKGNGTSKNEHDYTFTDVQPAIGINYYRIVDVDYNGVKTTSKTVSVAYTNQNAGNVLNIAPNPTVSSLSLSYEAQTAENSFMNIYDFNGRLILLQAINLTKGSNNARIDVSNLLSGIYIVKINNEVQRFVKM